MFIFIFLYFFHSSAALNIKRHLLSTLILSHVPWRGCIYLPTQYVTFFFFFLIVTVLFLNGLIKYLNHGFGLMVFTYISKVNMQNVFVYHDHVCRCPYIFKCLLDNERYSISVLFSFLFFMYIHFL